MTKVLPIDQMLNLTKQLGKTGTDRIRYAQHGRPGRKEPYATNLVNTVITAMQSRQPKDSNCPVNDTIRGVAALDHTQGLAAPINSGRLYAIFQCMPVINSREIMLMMNIEKRQAQRYMKAVKILLPLLERILSEELN